jgi:DUF4097 and DUF4098 domain-containing protein YvlB
MSRTPWLITGLLWLVPALAAADSEVDRVVPARPDGRVSISNVAGSVTVTGWDRDEVHVTGTLGRGVEELKVESRGGSVEIEVELMHHGRGWDSDARLEIRVPRASDVDVEVVSAEVKVSEVEGELTVESVSGSVEVAGRLEDLDVESVSGSIDVDADVDRASLESVSGRIRLEGKLREIEAGSVSGSVEIDTGEIRRAELETTSGRIEISGSLAAGAEIEAESHSGSVELSLPSSTSAHFEISTYSGRITNELGPPPDRARYGPSRELEFQVGGGDARVKVDTFSGSVSLRRRD